ncbi:hypothetical protein CYMTET_34807 [Cymbomonas tetramitiformis]|uniref:Carboxylic ester hydrolase n=1 Tax=Cymbomonas tetramitiformis TaxID=36881 RepID=A0AAE0KPL1_9CHLO|nr:hypothetical protein CYMTET_34807 [Cymbomonas tetramitiformis]
MKAATLVTLLLTASLPSSLALQRAPVEIPGSVRTPWGLVQGLIYDGSIAYLGIPFAESPERFAVASLRVSNFSQQPFMATRNGPACLQPKQYLKPNQRMSEDCLILNIFAPRRAASSSPKATMIWIHGGGLTTGSINSFNATRFASNQDVVVVAIQYRLGPLGFMPAYKTNVGIRDQRLAMEWVKRHILLFGGDSSKVTIFGESSGGQSVGVHLISPGSAGLFHAAVCQSGNINFNTGLSEATKRSEALARKVGCKGNSDLACLRAANVTEMVTDWSIDILSSASIIDKDVVPSAPVDAITRGVWNKVPFLLGNNRNEGDLFLLGKLSTTPSLTFEEAVCIFSNCSSRNIGAQLRALYPSFHGVDNRHVISQYMTDINFECDVWRTAQALCRQGYCPHVYHFDRTESCPYLSPGAYHSSEINFILQTAGTPEDMSKDPRCESDSAFDKNIADAMAAIWAGFAKRQVLPWPVYGPEETKLVIDTIQPPQQFGIATRLRSGFCAALQTLGVGSHDFIGLFAAINKCIQQ